MPDHLEFKISEGLILPIIEAKINAAIIEAMGGHDKMVAEMITAFMNQKVDSEGKEGRGYSCDKPRLSWLVTRMLEDAMKSALTEYLKTKQDKLQKEFEKFFNSKKGSDQLVKAMQDGLIAGLANQWTTTVTFKIPPRD